jgi:hypothetical protein
MGVMAYQIPLFIVCKNKINNTSLGQHLTSACESDAML